MIEKKNKKKNENDTKRNDSNEFFLFTVLKNVRVYTPGII